MEFTKQQQRAIDIRNTDILVSAAAGSGKTAVLVERIIQRILDEKQPVDIDRLLVMTFTKAAADQMRERILKAIEKKRKEDPFNKHLQKQSALIHNSHITTIHGFCLEVIKDHFHEIDLSPDFRVGDDGECRLLKHDVLETVLEKAYEEADEDFIHMSEALAAKKSDRDLEDIILKLHEFSMSYPDQEEWLKKCVDIYENISVENIEAEEWMQKLLADIRTKIAEALLKAQVSYKLTITDNGPYMYKEALESDVSIITNLSDCTSYSDLKEKLENIKFATLGRAKKSGPYIDPDMQELVKAGRDKYKKVLAKIKEDYFKQDIEQTAADIKENTTVVRTLTNITKAFSEEYSKSKRDRNIVDFNDLEHLCLDILIKGKDTTAKDYQNFFKEIYVDEYQDSNLVQETMVKLISGEDTHVFMVGDVKQSIYRFRLARPDLFINKYESFARDTLDADGADYDIEHDEKHNVEHDIKHSIDYDIEHDIKHSIDYDIKHDAKHNIEQNKDIENGDINKESGIRIDLSDNFRSRKEVLDSVNEIFERIMIKDVAGIEYDEAAKLHYGANYPEIKLNPDLTTLTNPMKSEFLLAKADDEIDSKELEAHLIASQIKKIIGVMDIWDADLGEYRKAKYSDIVILLRTNKGWDTVYENILTAEGISAHTASSTGYFEALEIQTVLDYLSVIDNPHQDIPLMSVLKSPFGYFTDEEIAVIRAEHKEGSLYEALCLAESNIAKGDSADGGDAVDESDSIEIDADSIKDDIYSIKNEVDSNKEECKGSESKVLDNNKTIIALTEIDKEKLQIKIHTFISELEKYRKMSAYSSVYDCLLSIVDGRYGRLISAMESGRKRKANLNMLIKKAEDYGKTSFKGLFHFVRYIELIKKYEVDYGEASLLDENDDTVRIMSIHKSKGLEFPICFVAGMQKAINYRDTRDSLVLDVDYGIGIDLIDIENRTKRPTLLKKAISNKLYLETLAEEMRVFYVALTRAKEKLYLTGVTPDPNKDIYKDVMLSTAGSFFDFYAYANGIDRLKSVHVAVKDVQDLITEKIEAVADKETVHEELRSIIAKNAGDLSELKANEELREQLQARINYRYPYADEKDSFTKISVTELKKRSMEAELSENKDNVSYEVQANFLMENNLLYDFDASDIKDDKQADLQDSVQPNVVPYIPRFIKEDTGEIPPTLHGTAFHRILELWDYSLDSDIQSVKDFMAEAVSKKRIEQDYYNAVKPEEVEAFLKSELASRMKVAYKKGKLKREQPFVIRMGGYLIQGIIDAYFEEDGELVIVDYKTDKVRKAKELKDKYHAQLDYYEKALEKLVNLKVKEKIIYSSYLKTVISL